MNTRINNIHDKFVKELLANREVAVAFLSEFLPSELVARLKFETLTYEPTSYLNTDLSDFFSDMVWSVHTQGEKEVKISILLEHKSYRDHRTSFQVLEYIALGYLSQLKSGKGVSLIIPLVYYHGHEQWEYQPLFSFFGDVDASFKRYLPIHDTEFVSLQALSNTQIEQLTMGLLQNALLIQKNYRDGNYLLSQVEKILSRLNPYLQSTPFRSIFVYLLQNENIDNQELRVKLTTLPTKLSDAMMSLYDELIQEGIEKGIEKEKIEVILKAFDNQIGISMIELLTNEGEARILEILREHGRISNNAL
jgi:predicted transposase/invertase (TIGR01784 family)